MKRLMAALAMSALLVTSLASVTTAADGNAYGKKIKACTGLSYGQLKNVARAGDLPGHDPSVIEGLKPAWGAKKTWLHIKPLCDPDADVPGIGRNMAYGQRIKECAGLSYGQLKLAAKAGELEGHDPALIEGLKPAWGAKKTWMHIMPFCTVEPAPDVE